MAAIWTIEVKIIFQAATSLLPEDSAETIAAKVLALEHRYFAEVIEGLLYRQAVDFGKEKVGNSWIVVEKDFWN